MSGRTLACRKKTCSRPIEKSPGPRSKQRSRRLQGARGAAELSFRFLSNQRRLGYLASVLPRRTQPGNQKEWSIDKTGRVLHSISLALGQSQVYDKAPFRGRFERDISLCYLHYLTAAWLEAALGSACSDSIRSKYSTQWTSYQHGQ